MKSFILLTVFIFAALIETSLYSIPFTLYLAVFLCIFEVRMASVWSLVAGIVLDILSFRLVGSSSLLFLLGIFAWHRISQKIQVSSFVYQAMLLISMVFAYHVFVLRVLFVPVVIRDMVLGIILLFIMGRIIPPVKKTTKLSLS